MTNPLKEIVRQFPANGGRGIILKWLKDFARRPSQMWGDKLEKITGYPYDFSENDWGNGPRGGEHETN